MRRLAAILVVLFAAAALCPAQTKTEQAVQQTPSPGEDTPLHQQLEKLKEQYGATKLQQFSAHEIRLEPNRPLQTIDYSGDSRGLLNRIATAYGFTATVDPSVTSRRVTFRLQNVSFETAFDTAAMMTDTFWVPVSPKEVLFAADTPQKRREFERMVQQTFYLSDANTPQQLNDVVNMLRTLFQIRYVTQQPASNSVTIRAPQRTVDAAEELLATLQLSRPQVILDVQTYEVNSSMLRAVGLNLPLQFQIFNIGSSALALLNSPNIQSLIDQLIASGGLTEANAGSIAALIGQLQNQQSSLLANPVATFGGGLTLFGIGIPPATLNLSMNESQVTSLENTTLQASQGNAATLHIGERYPVLTQSFSSGLTIPGANFNVVGAVPGFTYEDLGLTVKAKPQIHGDTAVTLDLELAIRSLGAQSFNDVPVIQNREYKGVITVKDGEPAVVAGMLSNTEQKSIRGLPGIGRLPVFDRLTSSKTNNNLQTELVVVITPHIVRTIAQTSPVIDVPKE